MICARASANLSRVLSRRALALLPAIVLALGTAGIAEHAHAGDPAPEQVNFTLGSLHAQYKFVGGEKQRAQIQAAVDAGIEGLPPGLYDLARKRISSTQKAWPTMRLDIEGADIRVDRGPEKPVHTTANKPKFVLFNKYGERYVFRQKVRGRTLTQVVTGIGNKTKMTYRFNEDGSKLTFNMTIDADLLPRPINYKLTYARVD